MALFNLGDFTLSSGAYSNFFIDCGALTDDDLRVLAVKAVETIGPFTHVEGVPRGGERFAEHLAPHCEPGDGVCRLLVDDVWSTGRSMQEYAHRRGAPRYHKFLVIFARDPARLANPTRALFILGDAR